MDRIFNDLFYGRSYIAAPAELSIPFLLDEKSTVVPLHLAGEQSGGKRGRGVKALIDAARKNDMKGILEILGSDAKSILESCVAQSMIKSNPDETWTAVKQ